MPAHLAAVGRRRLIGEAGSLDALIGALLREGAREGRLWAALERHRDAIAAAMPTGESPPRS